MPNCKYDFIFKSSILDSKMLIYLLKKCNSSFFFIGGKQYQNSDLFINLSEIN